MFPWLKQLFVSVVGPLTSRSTWLPPLPLFSVVYWYINVMLRPRQTPTSMPSNNISITTYKLTSYTT